MPRAIDSQSYDAPRYRLTKLTHPPPTVISYTRRGGTITMELPFADLLAGVATDMSREDVLQTLGLTTQPADVQRRALEVLFLSDWLEVEWSDGQEWVPVDFKKPTPTQGEQGLVQHVKKRPGRKRRSPSTWAA